MLKLSRKNCISKKIVTLIDSFYSGMKCKVDWFMSRSLVKFGSYCLLLKTSRVNWINRFIHLPWQTEGIDEDIKDGTKKVKLSSSSSNNVPNFPLMGSDVIWVISIVFYPLPYLLWCLASLCLLPQPYSRPSLAYLLAFYLPPPALLASCPSSLSISAQVSAASSNADLTYCTHSNLRSFHLVECYGLLASSSMPSIYSKHKISYPLLPIDQFPILSCRWFKWLQIPFAQC